MDFDPAVVGEAAAAQVPALSLGRRATEDEAVAFDTALEEHGVDDNYAATRHFVDETPGTTARFGGVLNHHITPLNRQQASVLTSTVFPDGSLSVGSETTVLSRGDLSRYGLAHVLDPDSGTVTPEGKRHLTTLGEQNVVNAHADGEATPNTIADTQRLNLDEVTRVLAQHERERAAEEAGGVPQRRGVTPDESSGPATTRWAGSPYGRGATRHRKAARAPRPTSSTRAR